MRRCIRALLLCSLLAGSGRIALSQDDAGLYGQAVEFLKAGDDSSAYSSFKNLLDSYPDSPYSAEARFRVGEYLYKNGFLLLAREKLQDYILRYPEGQFLDVSRGYLQKILRQYVEPTAEKIIKEGDSLFEKGEWSEALHTYYTARHFQASIPLLDEKIRASQLAIARQVITDTISRGDTYAAAGRWKEAADEYNRVGALTDIAARLDEKITHSKRMAQGLRDTISERHVQAYGTARGIAPYLLFVWTVFFSLCAFIGAVVIFKYLYRVYRRRHRKTASHPHSMFHEKRRKFLPSESYKYLKMFVRKYPESHTLNKRSMLGALLAKHGFIFTDEELEDLICQERLTHRYADFKEKIAAAAPETIEDYIAVFLAQYSDNWQCFLELFETVLIEHNIYSGYTRSQLMKKIEAVRKERKIADFMQDLNGQP